VVKYPYFCNENMFMSLTKLLLIVLHIILAWLVYKFPILAKFYATGLITLVFLFSFTVKNRLWLIYLMAYVTSAEVFTRMSKGLFFYESHKYLIIILSLAYIFRRGLKKDALIFVLYLVLLIPGVIKTMFLEANEPSFFIESIRKTVLFNIVGPVALGIAAMALVKEELTLEEFKELNFWILLPVITTVFYMIFKTPSLREIVFTTSAIKATSGGFGPNQVATILGLGMFSSFVLLLTEKDILSKSIYLFFLALISYRAFLTFSRGGTIVGIIMILIFIYTSWRSDFVFMKTKSFLGIGISALILGISFYLVMEVTSGIVLYRFTGKDRKGVQKKDITTGRIRLFEAELKTFYEYPFLGIGVGRAKIGRLKNMGFKGATHNEISRLLSEHGLFGIAALIVLLLAPIFTGALYKNNLFFYPFFAFWLLTISHSSMRLVAPALVYALSFLILRFYPETKQE